MSAGATEDLLEGWLHIGDGDPTPFPYDLSIDHDYDKGWTWDATSATLTLNGFTDPTDDGIYFECENDDTITIIFESDVNVGGGGISCEGNLIIDGSGGKLTIVSVYDGIYADGNISIIGGIIDISTNPYDEYDTSGISGDNVSITGGDVYISDADTGINAFTSVTISSKVVIFEDEWYIETGIEVGEGGGNTTFNSGAYVDITASYLGVATYSDVIFNLGSKVNIVTEYGGLYADTVYINGGRLDIDSTYETINAGSIHFLGGSGKLTSDGDYAVMAWEQETLHFDKVTVWKAGEIGPSRTLADKRLYDPWGEWWSDDVWLFINENDEDEFLSAVEYDTFTVTTVNSTLAGGVVSPGAYKAGSTVTATKIATPAGQKFTGWTFDPSVTLTAGTVTSDSVTFTMPFANVTATANFVDLFTVTIAGGKIDNGGPSFAAGDMVHIKADAPPAGQRFKEWTITPAVEFIEGKGSLTQPDSEFTMPAANVTVTAVFEPLPAGHFAITVNHVGKGVANPSVNSAIVDTVITLTATADKDNSFLRWEVVSGGVTLASTTDRITTFTMPANDVVIRAVFGAAQTGDYSSILLPLIAITFGIASISVAVVFSRKKAKHRI